MLIVYNKTAYFNEKNRRTASPPTVFVVYGLPCAGMKIGCHGNAVRFVVRSADGNLVATDVQLWEAVRGGSVC